MELVRILESANGGAALAALASRYGFTPEQASDVIRQAIPEIAFNIERNTLSRGGLADLVGALGSGHHQTYLENPAALTSPAGEADGQAIAAHIFGSRDATEAAARRIARDTGMDAEKVAAVLPGLAALAMGGVARSTASRFGDIFSQIPDIGRGSGYGGNAPQPTNTGAAPIDIPRQEPLPVPGNDGPVPGGNWNSGQRQRSPFDDLSDVIRRRGQTTGGAASGSIVRDILGQVLGFQKGGVISWIIRLIVMRYGWRILRALIFGRR